MRYRFGRQIGILLVAALLSACGTSGASSTGLTAAPTAMDAQAVNLEESIQKILKQADSGEVFEAAEKLQTLGRKIRAQKGSGLKDVAMLARAHRQLVHEAAKHEEKWIALAAAQTNEAQYYYNLAARAVLAYVKSRPHPGRVDLTFADTLEFAKEAADAMLDRFPTLPPDEAAKAGFKRRPGADYMYVVSATVFMNEAARMVQTDEDVYALQEVAASVVDRAVANPEVPRELVAQLAKWSARFHDLEPQKPGQGKE